MRYANDIVPNDTGFPNDTDSVIAEQKHRPPMTWGALTLMTRAQAPVTRAQALVTRAPYPSAMRAAAQ